MLHADRPPDSAPSRSQDLSGPALDFTPLDPRAIELWRTAMLIGFGIVLFLLLGAGVAVGVATDTIVWLLLAWLVLAAPCTWLCFWYPPRRYRARAYRIDASVLQTTSGVVFRMTRLVPLSRLQHVDLHRGPLERAFGLASLVLHTAGTHEATTIIPGLDADQAKRLRDHLVHVGGDDAV
jgi:hypothetical protein